MISVLLLAVRTSALRAPIAIRRSRMAALGAGSVEVEEKFAVSGDRDAFKARLNTFRCYAWMSVDKYTKAAGKPRQEVFDLIAADQI